MFTVSDDCTYWNTETIPIEYKSVIDAEIDFYLACEKAYKNNVDPLWIFDKQFSPYQFFNRDVYVEPTFQTVEDWFKNHQ